MKIINIKNIKSFNGSCGKLQELYNSKNVSMSYTVMRKDSKAHKHKNMEEVYYILKGKAKIKVNEKLFPIKAGDVFSIPKNKYHNVQEIKEKVELIVITYPGYDPKDVICL